MNAPGAVAVAAVMLLVAVAWRPVGLPWALFPRRWRRAYRSFRKHPPWWLPAKPRARQRSSRISKRLRAQALRADRRRCVYCGLAADLQVDHIVPWALGGLTCLWNVAVLCQRHNAVKSSYWKSPEGRVYYRPWRDAGDLTMAAAIVRRERWHRLSPWRLARLFL
jgi:5-methylcytosine-specific restriction endonuclease McrA